jgi:hypothetical protein
MEFRYIAVEFRHPEFEHLRNSDTHKLRSEQSAWSSVLAVVRRFETERIETIVVCVINGDGSMPVLICLCRATIDVSEIPKDNGYRLLAETLREGVLDAIARLHQAGPGPADFEREVYGELGQRMIGPQIYQCTSCGRLAVFRDRSDRVVRQWYKPENLGDKPPDLLNSLLLDTTVRL